MSGKLEIVQAFVSAQETHQTLTSDSLFLIDSIHYQWIPYLWYAQLETQSSESVCITICSCILPLDFTIMSSSHWNPGSWHKRKSLYLSICTQTGVGAISKLASIEKKMKYLAGAQHPHGRRRLLFESWVYKWVVSEAIQIQPAQTFPWRGARQCRPKTTWQKRSDLCTQHPSFVGCRRRGGY